MTLLRRFALVVLMLICVSLTFTMSAIAAAARPLAGAPLATAGGGFLPAGNRDFNTMPTAFKLSADPSQTAAFSARSDVQPASVHATIADFRTASGLSATPEMPATSAPIEPPSPKDRLIGRLNSHSGPGVVAPQLSTPSISCNSTWNTVSSPNSGTGVNFFASISGAAANDVWGVGAFINGSGVAQTLAEHWNGSAWSIVSTPNTGSGDNVLESVVAIASNDAWAVGYSRPDNSSGRQSLTEHWNGSAWSTVSAPPVASDTLFAVSAIASNDVWAVGVSVSSSTQWVSLVMHWDGVSWTLSSAPLSKGTIGTVYQLFGVRVVSSTNVWAVGDVQSSSVSPASALIEHWNGSSWTEATEATDNVNGDFLNDVAGTATDLWAVGGQFASATTDAVLIEHSTDGGTTWTDVAGVTPDQSANLFSVAYISGTNIYAAGATAYANSGLSNELDHTLIEQWNGTSWSQVTSANPTGNDDLFVIAAMSADDVWADGVGSGTTLAENFCTPPTITSVVPNTGPAVGGTSVVITGTGFTGATAVAFGTTAATSFHVDSDTQITATSPAHPGGLVDVTVTVQGTSSTSSSDKFTYVAPTPVVTSISPTSGPTAGGTPVTINGTGLLFATSVKFGTVPAASITSNTDTQIVAVSPAEAQSTVDVTVTTAGGTSATSSADHYSFVAPVPVVTAINPSAGGPAGGTSVTITGTGLSFATAVMFGSTPAASITSNTDTQIVAVSPAGTVGTAVDITVTTAGGTSATSAADQFTFNFISYFTWYDLASAGVNADTIHITNVSGAPAHGTISIAVNGVAPIPFTVPTGTDQFFEFPFGTIGGPVTISSDHMVIATLRAWYYQSFNETPARSATQAATVQYFPWYDLASAGTRADTIHITNVSGATATGTIALSGATTINFTVSSGVDQFFSFPYGTIGGPVTITSSTPVLASLRAWFNQSFNETAGHVSTSAALVSYFPWYDLSSAGMRAETIHITNESGAPATGTVTLGTNPALTFTALRSGNDVFVSFPYGTIGGPVTVTSDVPVITVLRAWYYLTFNEVAGRPQTSANTTFHFPWYDHASPGVNADTIHITNESGATATGTIALSGATTINFSVPTGTDAFFAFPPGTIGGPVTITSSQNVLVSLRAWYYQSFNEVPGY